MPRCLVSVNQALVSHAVDGRNSVLVGGFCCRLVAFLDGVVNTLDVGTHHSAHAHVMGASGNGLTGAFFCSG